MENQLIDEPLAPKVIETVAQREKTDVADLPPLFERVNPDALNKLFAPTSDGRPRDEGHVQFPYAGYTVAVYSDGNVELQDRDR